MDQLSPVDIWLPFGVRLQQPPKTKREELIRRLNEINVVIAGLDIKRDYSDEWLIDDDELKDLVEWQEERAAEDAARRAVEQTERALGRKLNPEEIREGLRDYAAFMRARRESRKSSYKGSGVVALGRERPQ